MVISIGDNLIGAGNEDTCKIIGEKKSSLIKKLTGMKALSGQLSAISLMNEFKKI